MKLHRTAKIALTLCGLTVLTVSVVVAAYWSELCARYHLHELEAAPERLYEFLAASGDPARQAAIDAFVRTPDGLQFVVAEFLETADGLFLGDDVTRSPGESASLRISDFLLDPTAIGVLICLDESPSSDPSIATPLSRREAVCYRVGYEYGFSPNAPRSRRSWLRAPSEGTRLEQIDALLREALGDAWVTVASQPELRIRWHDEPLGAFGPSHTFSTRPNNASSVYAIRPARGAIPRLARGLTSTNPDHRDAICKTLREFGPHAAPAIPELTRVIGTTPAAISTLAATGDQGRNVVLQAIRRRLDDHDFIFETLRRVADEEPAVIDLYRELLYHPFHMIRAECIYALRRRPSSAGGAFRELVRLLRDEVDFVRTAATAALVEIAPHVGHEHRFDARALRAACEDSVPAVRDQAARVVELLTERGIIDAES